jgi:hypothetical protein
MLTFFSELLKALPVAASSVYGLTGFIATILAWTVIAWRVKRNANLLKNLSQLPETDRLKALELEMGGVYLKEGMSADDWLKFKSKRYLLIGYVCTILFVLAILVIAIFKKPSNPEVDITLYRNEETIVQDQTSWKIEYTNDLEPSPDDDTFDIAKDSSELYHFKKQPGPQGDDEEYYDRTDPVITYDYSVAPNELIKIFPVFPYKQAMDKGEEMEGLSYWWIPFEYEFPALSLKVVNNTANTLLLSEVVVDIMSSNVNLSPILYVNDVYYYGSLSIGNEGWGKVIDPQLSVCFFIPGHENKFEEAKSKKIALDDFTEGFALNITNHVDDSLKQQIFECSSKIQWACVGPMCTSLSSDLECADPGNNELCKQLTAKMPEDNIKSLLEEVNQFLDEGEKKYTEKDIIFKRRCRDYPLDVAGVLSYTDEQDGKEKKFRFRTRVYLGEPGVGAPAPPTFFYDLYLEAGKSDYSIRLPISQVIKSGESDHFVIDVASNKSTSFDLKITVFDTKKRPVKTSNLSIDMIVPRSGLSYAKRRKA